ncbi:MAG: calcium/sodium antiporter [Alistipes sp.]
MDILLLLLGLVLILGGANYLTDGSAIVAQRFRIPEFIIGLTVIAVGTSTPELVVSVLSAIAGNSDVAMGNIVGSNIFNVFIILGICAIIVPIALTSSNIRRDIPIGLAVSLLLFIITSDRLLHLGTADQIGRGEGVLMIAIYIGVMWYTIRTSPRPSHATPEHIATEKNTAWWLSVVMIVGGLGALVAGGELFLRGATQVARDLGVSESVIAITLVAGGTSLPELASSLVSLMKGKAEMALGNVIGSNIANILLILGISATIHPLTMGGITPNDIGMVVLSSVMLFVTAFTFRRRAIDRWEGIIFIAIYATYIFYLLK